MYKEYSSLGEHIVIKRSTRARRLALRLDSKARVFNLVVPKRVSLKAAENFAYQHQDWIDEQLAMLPESISFINGRTIPVFGRDTRLVIDFDDELKRTKIEFVGDDVLLVQTNLEDVSPRIVRFLKAEAKKRLTILAEEKAAYIGKTVTQVSVRDTKSRWGSCSVDGSISLSWRLIFAPVAASDYVVAHEVAHLKHMDHSKAFWDVCESLSADYKTGKGWMRRQGKSLMRYG